MPTRTLEIDLRQGTGADSEPMYGVVTVQRAKAKTTGGFEILPFETSLKLINGKATITEAETDGKGPFYDSVYLFRVQNGYCGHRYGFMAALPDGTTPITTGELPMVDPITGEGIYMDAQEWNDLYGDLPNRVSSLETGKANTSHTHVIGDVTGLQTALNTKGNATVRFSETAGKAVYLTKPGTSTEHLIYGDTGMREISTLLANGWTVTLGGKVLIFRQGYDVTVAFDNLSGLAATSAACLPIPEGYRPATDALARGFLVRSADGSTYRTTYGSNTLSVAAGKGVEIFQGAVSWRTNDAWPTSLVGSSWGSVPSQ